MGDFVPSTDLPLFTGDINTLLRIEDSFETEVQAAARGRASIGWISPKRKVLLDPVFSGELRELESRRYEKSKEELYVLQQIHQLIAESATPVVEKTGLVVESVGQPKPPHRRTDRLTGKPVSFDARGSVVEIELSPSKKSAAKKNDSTCTFSPSTVKVTEIEKETTSDPHPRRSVIKLPAPDLPPELVRSHETSSHRRRRAQSSKLHVEEGVTVCKPGSDKSVTHGPDLVRENRMSRKQYLSLRPGI